MAGALTRLGPVVEVRVLGITAYTLLLEQAERLLPVVWLGQSWSTLTIVWVSGLVERTPSEEGPVLEVGSRRLGVGDGGRGSKS